jgi:hypothetical protein
MKLAMHRNAMVIFLVEIELESKIVTLGNLANRAQPITHQDFAQVSMAGQSGTV